MSHIHIKHIIIGTGPYHGKITISHRIFKSNGIVFRGQGKQYLYIPAFPQTRLPLIPFLYLLRLQFSQFDACKETLSLQRLKIYLQTYPVYAVPHNASLQPENIRPDRIWNMSIPSSPFQRRHSLSHF